MEGRQRGGAKGRSRARYERARLPSGPSLNGQPCGDPERSILGAVLNAAVKGTKKQIRMDVLQGGRKLRLHARKKTALSYEVFYEHGDAYKLAIGPHGRPIEASGRVNPDQGRLFMQFFLPPSIRHFANPLQRSLPNPPSFTANNEIDRWPSASALDGSGSEKCKRGP